MNRRTFLCGLTLGILGAPPDHRAARTRRPDAIAIEAAVQVAAALVLLVEGVEVGQEFATLSAHVARLGALPATRATQELTYVQIAHRAFEIYVARLTATIAHLLEHLTVAYRSSPSAAMMPAARRACAASP